MSPRFTTADSFRGCTNLCITPFREVVKACQVLQEFGFPLMTDIVGQIVKDYLTSIARENPFTESTLGRTGGKCS